jgi:acyl-coenzyme A thioesterase PaaI-like protein
LIRHHDLCFGCGQANLFGLQLEAELDGERSLAGRFFLKQDHQGPPGIAHGGIVATALDEAMALLAHGLGERTLTRRLEVDLLAGAPIGTVVDVRAWVEDEDARSLTLGAEVSGETPLGRARGVFVRVQS